VGKQLEKREESSQARVRALQTRKFAALEITASWQTNRNLLQFSVSLFLVLAAISTWLYWGSSMVMLKQFAIAQVLASCVVSSFWWFFKPAPTAPPSYVDVLLVLLPLEVFGGFLLRG
jgi:hypothetical protein